MASSTKEIVLTTVWASCSRTNHGDFRLNIRDDKSIDWNIEISLTAEQFAHLISGIVVSGLTAEIRGLTKIGKKRVTKRRAIYCPLRTNRAALEQWLIANAQEDGWEIDPYLGSQDSIKFDDNGRTLLMYKVYKWVEDSEDN